MKDFEEMLQAEIDKLPYEKHLDDGCYNDGQIAGFELGARWAHDMLNTESSLPISSVVFFELKNGKYIASNGVEITTAFLMEHGHEVFEDKGYVIIEKK